MIIWFYFVKYVGVWQLRMNLFNHGIVPIFICALIVFGFVRPRQKRYEASIPHIDEDGARQTPLPSCYSGITVTHRSSSRRSKLGGLSWGGIRLAVTLRVILPAIFFATISTFAAFFVAYWSLTATNFGWTHNIRDFSKSFTLSELTPTLRLNAVSLVEPDTIDEVTRTFCQDDDYKSSKVGCYPLVFKPDQCTTDSRGVQVIHTKEEALIYIKERDDARKEECTMIQQYYNEGEEFVIFYVRFPYRRKGFIKSIGHRNKMIGFDKAYSKSSAKRENHGSYTIDEVDNLGTPELLSALNDISYNITGFHSGRLDIKARNKLALQRGEFFVLEINQNAIGCISEKRCCCTTYWKDKFGQWAFPNNRHWYHQEWILSFRAVRTMAMQIWIGFNNILFGNVTLFTLVFKGIPSFRARTLRCGNQEHWVARP
eukprot:CAMPEP_0195524294 /NCGR_PEP_ID=MMETSP0794_2-20130614/24017_1 /TAXON_ID=515487 /ORGANISM="Stephanopyxis turris, Strain CCMP 815" /LENGTH=427 /DNA_ID=CAMNT_0040654477 /DNA_START=680 /DNA_END=1963 /DNA_ORIENTATION=-